LAIQGVARNNSAATINDALTQIFFIGRTSANYYLFDLIPLPN
jgi:hypothetical protein